MGTYSHSEPGSSAAGSSASAAVAATARAPTGLLLGLGRLGAVAVLGRLLGHRDVGLRLGLAEVGSGDVDLRLDRGRPVRRGRRRLLAPAAAARAAPRLLLGLRLLP